MFQRLKKIYDLMTPRDRRALPLLVVFGLINTVLESLGIGLVFPLLLLVTDLNAALENPYIAQLYSMSGLEKPAHLIYLAGIIFLVVLVIKNIVGAGISIWNYYFTQRIGMSLSCSLFTRYLKAPYIWHVQANSSEMIRNVDAAVVKTVEAVLIPAVTLSNEFLIVSGIIVVLLLVDPVISILLAGFVVLLAATYYLLTRRYNMLVGQRLMQVLADLLKTMQEAIGAIKEIRVLGREDAVAEIFNQQRKRSMIWRSIFGAMMLIPHYFVETGLGFAMVGGLFLVLYLHGAEAAIPTLGIIAAAGLRLLPSTNRILNGLQTIRSGLPAADLVIDDYRTLDDLASQSPAQVIPQGHGGLGPRGGGEIEFRNVSFKYETRDSSAVDNFSLLIPFGSSIGFVGASGAGKTTLIDLLIGLLHPQEGRILIDGNDISSNMRAWQKRIGYVPQNVFLLDDSIARNIALGVPDEEIDEERIWQACELACLDEFLREVPEGLSAHVGEKGVRISGGQRQRVGIARALYHDPEIVVLDEATSALDSETEARLSDVIAKMAGAKTIIVVAHRLSTVRRCDRIAFLKDGQLIDVDSFESLADRNEDFSRMVDAAALKKSSHAT